MSAPVIAAAIRLAERRIERRFQSEGATSPASARGIHLDGGPLVERRFRRLVARGVIRESGPDAYYFDEAAYAALRLTRRRLAFGLIALVMVLALLVSLRVIPLPR